MLMGVGGLVGDGDDGVVRLVASIGWRVSWWWFKATTFGI